MEFYQFCQRYIKHWSFQEQMCFLMIFAVCTAVCSYWVYKRRITFFQMAAGLALVLFLWIVLESTIFTRKPEVRRYELVLFWSWYEVFVNRNWNLLIENVLNCILLLPMGFLLPFVFQRKIRWSTAFLAGCLVSACIESGQLLLRRGLFEWDDMIHNGAGCMAGSSAANLVLNRLGKFFGEKKNLIDNNPISDYNPQCNNYPKSD